MHYNARYYDPAVGRFISADTIVPNPMDPQQLNRYSYVRNNPVLYRDPSGHCSTVTDDLTCIMYARDATIEIFNDGTSKITTAIDSDYYAYMEDRYPDAGGEGGGWNPGVSVVYMRPDDGGLVSTAQYTIHQETVPTVDLLQHLYIDVTGCLPLWGLGFCGGVSFQGGDFALNVGGFGTPGVTVDVGLRSVVAGDLGVPPGTYPGIDGAVESTTVEIVGPAIGGFYEEGVTTDGGHWWNAGVSFGVPGVQFGRVQSFELPWP